MLLYKQPFNGRTKRHSVDTHLPSALETVAAGRSGGRRVPGAMFHSEQVPETREEPKGVDGGEADVSRR